MHQRGLGCAAFARCCLELPGRRRPDSPRLCCLERAAHGRTPADRAAGTIDELLPTPDLSVLRADVRRRRSRGPQGQPDHRRHRADGIPGHQGAASRGRRDRRADRRRDRLHGRRLGQEGHRGQGGLAHQPHAQARPRHADRRPRQAQALRGHSGRSARLHRRLCVPGRGDARIHRQEPRLAPQAICRHAEDAVLRRARRLRRKKATSCGPARATTAASSTAAARSGASSSSIWAKRSFATISTIRSSNSAIS